MKFYFIKDSDGAGLHYIGGHLCFNRVYKTQMNYLKYENMTNFTPFFSRVDAEKFIVRIEKEKGRILNLSIGVIELAIKDTE